MAAKFEIGRKVRIKPADSGKISLRDCAIDEYAGQVGEIIDYYWLNTRNGEVIYIYTVRVGSGLKEIALHDDEIEAHIE
jgi:hypothetical protein